MYAYPRSFNLDLSRFTYIFGSRSLIRFISLCYRQGVVGLSLPTFISEIFPCFKKSSRRPNGAIRRYHVDIMHSLGDL
jgi:hypothetical protein